MTLGIGGNGIANFTYDGLHRRITKLDVDPGDTFTTGQLAIRDASFGSRLVSSFANPYTYTGRRFDAESGLYYYRNRYYHCEMNNPTFRRWVGANFRFSLLGFQWLLTGHV